MAQRYTTIVQTCLVVAKLVPFLMKNENIDV